MDAEPAPGPVALDAAAAPGTGPLDAIHVWPENLPAGSATSAGPAGFARAAGTPAAGTVPRGIIEAAAADPADEYLVDLWPGDFADQSHGVEG